RTLADILRDRPNPSAERGRLVAVFEQVCQAVAYAHAQGVIHRDLKPANVMVGAFGEVQVMDWGLAKAMRTAKTKDTHDHGRGINPLVLDSPSEGTQAGSILGTPAYMAPEQAAGEIAKIDERSDVFGLGAVLCTILTGRPPYEGPTAFSVRTQA